LTSFQISFLGSVFGAVAFWVSHGERQGGVSKMIL
jgi:hypothetical protein